MDFSRLPIEESMEVLRKPYGQKHFGIDWSGETDGPRLLHVLQMVMGPKSSEVAEGYQQVYNTPTNQWMVEFSSVAMMALIHLEPSLKSTLIVPLNSYEKWKTVSGDFLARTMEDATASDFAKFAKSVRPILVSYGWSVDEISAVMKQTDFAPDPKADSDNELFQQLKTAGNMAYKEKDFAVAMSAYRAALALPNLSSDSRAVLWANSATCELESKEFESARYCAQQALRWKAAWFKPHIWLFRSCNAQHNYLEVLDSAGVVPNAFPPEWLPKAEAEVRLAIKGMYEKMVNSQNERAGGGRMQQEKQEKQEKPPSGSMKELTERCNAMVRQASEGIASGKMTEEEAISLQAQAILLGRGVPICISPAISKLLRDRGDSGIADTREYLIVRIVLNCQRNPKESMRLANRAIKKWLKDCWFYETRSVLKMGLTQDGDSALGDIAKAAEYGPTDDVTLYWMEAVMFWHSHLAKYRDRYLDLPSKRHLDENDLNPIEALAHLPIQERVPQKCFNNLIQFISKAPADHQNLPDAHFEIAHMYYVEEQIELSLQFYDLGCNFERRCIAEGTISGKQSNSRRRLHNALKAHRK